jgi:DNA-binding MarR family transcriptional regulator
MPAKTGKDTRERKAIVEQLDMAGRILSTAAIVFHTTMAAKQGLSPIEEKALDFLQRIGPHTAGELGERLGLAPASVTGLIDRLEKKGFAKRVSDESDKRRVRVEVDMRGLAKYAPLFADFVKHLHVMYEGYSTDELKVVLRFLTEAARVQSEAEERLRALRV